MPRVGEISHKNNPFHSNTTSIMGLFDLFPWLKHDDEAKKRAEKAINGQDTVNASQDDVDRVMRAFDQKAKISTDQYGRRVATLPDDILDPLLSNFSFGSVCHQRYQNGQPVQGLQVCPRHIMIRKNRTGCQGYRLEPGDGYIVSAVNGDTGGKQFADKPMRLIQATKNEILLRGYTVQAMSPYGWMEMDLSDYGLSISFLPNGSIVKCVLHLYDRNTRIEYYKEKPKQKEREEITLSHGEYNILSFSKNRLDDGRPLIKVCANPVMVSKDGSRFSIDAICPYTVWFFLPDESEYEQSVSSAASSHRTWETDMSAYVKRQLNTPRGKYDSYIHRSILTR